MSEEPQKKKVTPRNLAVALVIVILIQLSALLITYVDLPSLAGIVASSGPSADFAGTSAAGSVANAAVLVLFAFSATLLLLWALRRKMVRSFKVVVFGSVAISAFVLTPITTDSVLIGRVSENVEFFLDFAIASALVVIIGYTIFAKNSPLLSSVVLAFVGAEVGAFFAGTLNLYTALALPIAFSLYDIYAVFRGPLKHLVGGGQGLALNGMSVKLGEFTLGLGDVVFYSMLPSLALVLASSSPPLVPPAATLATTIAIDLGVLVTLTLLARRRLLPGLPIPMLLGVAALGVFLL